MEFEEDMAVIPYDEYERLLQAQRKLTALEEMGVDNWQGYDEAMALLDRELSDDRRTARNTN